MSRYFSDNRKRNTINNFTSVYENQIEYDGTKEDLQEKIDMLQLFSTDENLIYTLQTLKNKIIGSFALYSKYKTIYTKDVKIINKSNPKFEYIYLRIEKPNTIKFQTSYFQILYFIILVVLISFITLVFICYYFDVNVTNYLTLNDFC